MKKDFQGIIANDELCNYLTSAIRSNSLSHAYILLGGRGCGKHTLAYLIAQAINCENKENDNYTIPCSQCNSCKKIGTKNSVDVILVGREDNRATIGVETIRFIKNDIHTYPNDGDFKIYIIEDAHTMTIAAQNALLLSLEEPPKYALFILLCENTENILETIKSRAPTLRLRTPSEDEAVEFLKENHPNARAFINNSRNEFEQIYKASGGNIGQILELIESKDKKQILQNRELATSLIEALSTRSLSKNYFDILLLFSQKRDELGAQLLEIQKAARDLMLIKKSDSPNLLFFTDSEYAEELSYSFSTQRISEILEASEDTRLALMQNGNVRLALTNFLTKLI